VRADPAPATGLLENGGAPDWLVGHGHARGVRGQGDRLGLGRHELLALEVGGAGVVDGEVVDDLRVGAGDRVGHHQLPGGIGENARPGVGRVDLEGDIAPGVVEALLAQDFDADVEVAGPG